MCLSPAITWAGFDNFYYFFTHEDLRDAFAIPHDLKILEGGLPAGTGRLCPRPTRSGGRTAIGRPDPLRLREPAKTELKGAEETHGISPRLRRAVADLSVRQRTKTTIPLN